MTLSTILHGLFGRSNQTPPLAISPAHHLLKNADVAPDVRRIIRQRQYCKMLLKDAELPFDELSIRIAWESMQQEMALVPPGQIQLSGVSTTINPQRVDVAAHYMDRYCVTNADFAQFVDSGGYNDTRLWPESILTDLLKFTDNSGHPGPKYWTGGKPPKEQLDHPVVGVCWFEANAYAQWVGKRLPSPAQWQRAATWGKSSGGSEPRYPWGNTYIQGYANLWTSRVGGTVPVNQFAEGATPSGVQQMTGNTWEWMNGHFALNLSKQEATQPSLIFAELRGGAFDTYFSSQATCQFRTGQPLLVRAANIGFRCCIETNQIIADPNKPTHQGEE